MPPVKVLLVSSSPVVRELMELSVRSIERRLGEPLSFLEAVNGEQGAKVAVQEAPEVIVADETQSRAGAFHLARELRGMLEPYRGAIVILLDRPHDAWLAKWSGADAWFTKPADPFELADRIIEIVQSRPREHA